MILKKMDRISVDLVLFEMLEDTDKHSNSLKSIIEYYTRISPEHTPPMNPYSYGDRLLFTSDGEIISCDVDTSTADWRKYSSIKSYRILSGRFKDTNRRYSYKDRPCYINSRLE